MDKKTAAAVANYTEAACIRAYQLNARGEGARTVGCMLGLTTAQADAAINAGRTITEERTRDAVRGSARCPLCAKKRARIAELEAALRGLQAAGMFDIARPIEADASVIAARALLATLK